MKLTEIMINLAVFIKDVRPQLVYYIPIHTQIIDSYNNPCRQVTDFYNYNIDFFVMNSMIVIITDHIDLVLIKFSIIYYY